MDESPVVEDPTSVVEERRSRVSRPPPTTRPLTTDDQPTSTTLSSEAFGYDPGPDPTPFPVPGRHEWGTLADGVLVAQVVALELESWFGGVAVPTTGIAGVSVAAESRGSGLLDDPMRAVLAEGHDRGELLSTLYPTAPGIYRRFGFEVVASLLEVDLPTAALPLRPSPGVTLRRAAPEDVPAIRAAYDAWASAQHGPLSRRTPTFTADPAAFLSGATGVTLAEVDGEVRGYVRWRRGEGYDAASVLVAQDLTVLDARAGDALWAFLAGWASVAPTTRLTTSGHDLVRLGLRSGDWRLVRERPYMLRLTDVARALALRPAVVDGSATITVAADAAGPAESLSLSAEGGAITAQPALAAEGPTFTSRALALWYAGVQTCPTLRMAGLLTGPDHHDRFLDRVLEHRPFHIRDYF